MRGPLVYCLEQADNGEHLWNLSVRPGTAEIAERPELLRGVTTITCRGERDADGSDELYTEDVPAREEVSLTYVPYYAWGNRGRGEMTVWVRRA